MTTDPWKQMREQMPVVANASYLDHAAVAPLSGPAADRVIRWNQEAAEQGDLVWPKWAAEVEGIRETCLLYTSPSPRDS